MPIKVELSDAVGLFLNTECLLEEREAFVVCVRLLAKDPESVIEHSQVYRGRTRQSPAPRFFRFGGCLAYFHYYWTGDPKTDRIRIETCRRVPPTLRD